MTKEGLWRDKQIEYRRSMSGFSGARVELIYSGAQVRVRKTSSDIFQNARLMAQESLQAAAYENDLATPRVLGSGFHGDLFCFEMGFIQGESVALSVREGQQIDFERLLDFIDQIIESFVRSEKGHVHWSSFESKINEIEAKCHHILEQFELKQDFDQIRKFVLEQEYAIPQSDCHGDLTLENILVTSQQEFFLIDFDAPSIKSWVLDIGKLLQDCWGHWCLRDTIVGPKPRGSYANAALRLKDLSDALEHRILRPRGVDIALMRKLCIFHLLRVLPYTKDYQILRFILKRANRVMNEA